MDVITVDLVLVLLLFNAGSHKGRWELVRDTMYDLHRASALRQCTCSPAFRTRPEP